MKTLGSFGKFRTSKIYKETNGDEKGIISN